MKGFHVSFCCIQLQHCFVVVCLCKRCLFRNNRLHFQLSEHLSLSLFHFLQTAAGYMATQISPPASNPADSATIESLALFSAGTVDQLSDGFLAVLEPELCRVQKSLSELM